MRAAPAARKPKIARAPRCSATTGASQAASSTPLPAAPPPREALHSRRLKAPLSASGVALWGEEQCVRAWLIQHWKRYHRRAGSKVLARRLNRCMHRQTNAEQVRRLRASLPNLSTMRRGPRKPPKQYRPRFPVIVAEDCLWPLIESDR